MELYTQAGRRGVALRQYQTCVRVLKEELAGAHCGQLSRLEQKTPLTKLDSNRKPGAG
jgi:hypothetical protein